MDTDGNEYFSSYEDLEVHKLMLEDTARVQTYKDAILGNMEYFKDKVVMDVGCGTGILSIFCAQAGAKKVYAVEASNLATLARELVEENNLQNIIEVLHSKVEDVVLPQGLKVDAIVSEWMGFYLLHEGMLDSVLFARDMFLKSDGHMFPESAVVYVAPSSLPTLHEKWNDFMGVKMSSFGKHLRQSKSSKPEIMTVLPENLIGPENALCYINLKEDHTPDLDLYSLQYIEGASRSGLYQGIAVWFICMFPGLSTSSTSQVALDTSPHALPTHWKQTVIVLPLERNVDMGEPIAFQLDMKRDSAYNRRYTLQVTELDPDTVEHPTPCTCHMTKCILTKAFMEKFPDDQGDAAPTSVLEKCDIDLD